MRTSTIAPARDHVWISERFQILVRSIDVVVVATGPKTATMICASAEDYERGWGRAEAALKMLRVQFSVERTDRVQTAKFTFYPISGAVR